MLKSHAFQIVPFVDPALEPNEVEPPEADPHCQIPTSTASILFGKTTSTSTRQVPLTQCQAEMYVEGV